MTAALPTEAKAEVRTQLVALSEVFVAAVCAAVHGAREGIVRTVGEPPYRRVDLGARALCYVRVRERLSGVRVELSSFWGPPPEDAYAAAAAVCVRASNGVAMRLSGAPDVATAVALIAATVEAGLESERRRLARREQQ